MSARDNLGSADGSPSGSGRLQSDGVTLSPGETVTFRYDAKAERYINNIIVAKGPNDPVVWTTVRAESRRGDNRTPYTKGLSLDAADSDVSSDAPDGYEVPVVNSGGLPVRQDVEKFEELVIGAINPAANTNDATFAVYVADASTRAAADQSG